MRKTAERDGEGRKRETHFLLTFPRVTRVAHKHKFRNLDKEDIDFVPGMWLWPSVHSQCSLKAFIYSSAETQLIISNLLASPDTFIYSSYHISLIQNCQGHSVIKMWTWSATDGSGLKFIGAVTSQYVQD